MNATFILGQGSSLSLPYDFSNTVVGSFGWGTPSATLPAGLSFDAASGVISGTPTGAASFTVINFPWRATLAVGGATTPVSGNVNVAMSIVAAGSLSLTFGQTVNWRSDTGTTLLWTGSLPPGLSVNTVSDGGSGVGVLSVTGTVGNQSGIFTTSFTTFVVAAPNPAATTVISAAGVSVVSGVNTITLSAGSFAIQFSATNGGTNWTGSLPGNTSINSFGLFSGSLSPGNYSLIIQAQNYAWHIDGGYYGSTNGPAQVTNYAVTLVVTPAIPNLSPTGYVGSGNYTVGDTMPNQQLYSVQDYAKPVVWSATGLPDGVEINPTTGAVSGRMIVAGNYNATFIATNATGSGSYEQQIVVAAQQNVPGVSLSAQQPGSSGQGGYGQQDLSFVVGKQVTIFFDGSYNPTSWAAADLPTGLTINAVTGVISGILRIPGTFRFFVTATNNVGPSDALGVTVTATGAAQAFQFISDDPTLIDLQIDQRSGTIASSRTVSFKQFTRARFALVFLDFGSPVAPPDAASLKMLIRQQDQFEADALFPSPAATLVAATETQPAYLLVELDISGDKLATVFKTTLDASTPTPSLAVMTDVTWTSGGILRASQTFNFAITPAVTY